MKANKHLLLWSSLGTLLLLAWAAFEENFLQDWRVAQTHVVASLVPDKAAAFREQLRQIVVPSLKIADRCVSCHVGMAPGETGLAGDATFGPHPDVVHDPANFGCTVCHGGQGRATAKADAHGAVPHWPRPIIPKKYAYAGCGTCHTHLAVPDQAQLSRGRALVERHDCLACHRIDQRGGTLRPGGAGGLEGPELSRIGARGFATDWYEAHLAKSSAATAPPWKNAVGSLSAADRGAIEVYLGSRVGAPGLVESKALFHSLGCRGCHKIGGVGGDDGPDLTHAGDRDPGQTSFDHVAGPRTIENWLKEHFRSPSRVVPGSQMPVFGLTEPQIEQLTFYMFSLRRSEFPESFWPKDRISAERFGEREFSQDGATLYGTFCAACHGSEGQGMRYPGMAAFPAIGNPDFLAVASNALITETIQHGRPGRRMPAWGSGEGSLLKRDLPEIIAHLRSLGGGIQQEADPKPHRWATGDTQAGRRLYLTVCSGCHGLSGEGREGPALVNQVLLRSASDTYLFETIRRGRRGTSMPAFGKGSTVERSLAADEIESIVSFLRTWEKQS